MIERKTDALMHVHYTIPYLSLVARIIYIRENEYEKVYALSLLHKYS